MFCNGSLLNIRYSTACQNYSAPANWIAVDNRRFSRTVSSLTPLRIFPNLHGKRCGFLQISLHFVPPPSAMEFCPLQPIVLAVFFHRHWQLPKEELQHYFFVYTGNGMDKRLNWWCVHFQRRLAKHLAHPYLHQHIYLTPPTILHLLLFSITGTHVSLLLTPYCNETVV